MIRSIRSFLLINQKQTQLPVVCNQSTTLGLQYQFSNQQNSFNKSTNKDDDDESLSFSDLLHKQEREKELEEKRKEFQQKFLNFDARKIAYQNMNVTEKVLDDSEIVRHKKQSYIYTNTDNIYYNPDAASIHRALSVDEETLREWSYNFKMTHKRRPSLRDMEEDPDIKQILETRQKKRNDFRRAVFKFRFN